MIILILDQFEKFLTVSLPLTTIVIKHIYISNNIVIVLFSELLIRNMFSRLDLEKLRKHQNFIQDIE